MPLRAFVANQEILAPSVPPVEWTDLKKKIRRSNLPVHLPCCGMNGYLRTSPLGLQHFVHKKSENNCDWRPESLQHLEAKYSIIQSCASNGWQAIPEFSEKDWRADVFAFKDSARIAFEVQWSKQTLEETLDRQQKYERDGIRGY